jgi:hypothetical protein
VENNRRTSTIWSNVSCLLAPHENLIRNLFTLLQVSAFGVIVSTRSIVFQMINAISTIVVLIIVITICDMFQVNGLYSNVTYAPSWSEFWTRFTL